MNLNSFQPKDPTETMESLPFAMNGKAEVQCVGNITKMGIGRIQNGQLTGRLDKLKV